MPAMAQEQAQTLEQTLVAGGRDMNGKEIGVQTVSKAPGVTNDLAAARASIEGDHDALGGGPGLLDMMPHHVGFKLRFGLFGGQTQGNLAQGGQVALAKEVIKRGLNALCWI